MQRIKLKALGSLVLVLLVTGIVFAQQQESKKERRNQNRPGDERGQRFDRPDRFDFMADQLNLTEEQQTKMKSMRTAFLNEINPLKAEKQIKMAEMKALEIKDQASEKEINALVKDFADIDSQILKAQIMHRRAIRDLLNDDQKAIFDAQGPMGPSNGRGGHRGNRPGCPMADDFK